MSSTTVPSAARDSRPSTPTWGRALQAGLISGAVAAVAALAVFAVWSVATDRDYEQISAGSIVVATLVAVTIGALVYRVLATRFARPVRAFVALAVFGIVVETVMAAATAAAEDYDGGFLVLTTLLHLVVAGVAVALVPRLAARR